MTGLMRKDLLVLRKQLRTYLIFLVIYGALSVAGLFPLAAVAAMIQILMVMLPISAFSFDEIARWTGMPPPCPAGGGPWSPPAISSPSWWLWPPRCWARQPA